MKIPNIKTIILARGGSKGIPQKNIVSLNGKPLIAYAIEAAKSSIANDVWVSTDCTNIKEVAIKYGAKIIIRPDNISGDASKSDEALMHFAQNQDFDILVFIQPTSPLIKADDINKGLELMADYDSVFSAYKEHWTPRWTLDGKPDNWDTKNRPMRQDVPAKYVENGAFYITTKQALLKSKCRYSGKIGIVEMPLWRSFQIDTPEDLELIKKLL
jgi:CMP-N,N'-diacetyllegionaminic acid synthase